MKPLILERRPKRRSQRLFLVILALMAVIVLLLVGWQREQPESLVGNNLVSQVSDYEVTGTFSETGETPIEGNVVASLQRHHPGLLLWSSWAGADQNTGSLTSVPFTAPMVLTVWVAGYPNAEGNQLLLENVETQAQYKLSATNPGESWRQVLLWVPLSWQGHPIRLVARDQTTTPGGWLGVSSPQETGWLSLLGTQLGSLVILPLYLLYFVLFLAPSLFVVLLMIQFENLHPALTLMLAILVSAVWGYGLFWLYFLNHIVGIIGSVLMLLLGLYSGVAVWRQRSLQRFIQSPDVLFPTLLMFLVGLFYLSLLYVFDPALSANSLAQTRFFAARPSDNTLPLLLAEKLYAGKDPRQFLGDWQSSDRPPLQSGIVLLERPVLGILSLGVGYQLLGTIAQCSWIAALWAYCRTAFTGTKAGYRLTLVLATAIFSGFYLYNSVYVWPKLLAGAFTLFAFTLLLQEQEDPQIPSTGRTALAAIAAGLGLLSHGSAVFTLPAMILVLILLRRVPDWRSTIIGVVLCGMLLAPWAAYQKFFDPPGDRLVKMHIAGVQEIDPRSSWSAIYDAYHGLNPLQLGQNKWENLKTIVGAVPLLESAQLFEHPTLITNWRLREREHIIPALGLLNLGWLGLLGLWLGGGQDRHKGSPYCPGSNRGKRDQFADVGIGNVFWRFDGDYPQFLCQYHASFHRTRPLDFRTPRTDHLSPPRAPHPALCLDLDCEHAIWDCRGSGESAQSAPPNRGCD
ncbi:hypothetical protein [Neosynechococcus sphagnicola]|nr:hypothetical protein [Neosynechococcus sphagnicola]